MWGGGWGGGCRHCDGYEVVEREIADRMFLQECPGLFILTCNLNNTNARGLL